MPLEARRIFRLSATTALALVIAYGAALPLPFIAPILAVQLTASGTPPMGLKGLLGFLMVMLLTLATGLCVAPVLVHYPVAGVLLVALGLYGSTYLSLSMGKALVGTLLTLGLTIIPAAGVYDFQLAVEVIKSLALGTAVAILCQWVVYPWFPEDGSIHASPPPRGGAERANWMALRVTLIILPPLILALSNPSMYLKVIMKTAMLGQQGSTVDARNAGRELLGSTFLGGLGAILFWIALKIDTSLWMFFLWTLLFFVYFAGKIRGVFVSRLQPSFWQNVAVTMLILIGSAVQDSANGKDVYQAFLIRMSMFLAVTFYAWAAILVLEQWRLSRRSKRAPRLSVTGTLPC